jgi:hypothetical protein
MSVESNLLSGYNAAYKVAREELASVDPYQLAARCGAEFRKSDGSLVLTYLGKAYAILWPSGRVVQPGSSDEAPVTVSVLLLNYVLSARAEPNMGDLIAFREIPGASVYEPSFLKRAVDPLVRAFGGKPELLLAAGERLGGVRAEVADTGITLQVLPLLPITYGVWQGDAEFPSSGVILFRASARRLLTVECLVVAASNGAYELIKLAREISTT